MSKGMTSISVQIYVKIIAAELCRIRTYISGAGDPVERRAIEYSMRPITSSSLRDTAHRFTSQASSSDPKLAHISSADKQKVATLPLLQLMQCSAICTVYANACGCVGAKLLSPINCKA